MSLNQHLQRQHRHLEGLDALLSEERDLLSQCHVDGQALAAVAQRKINLLNTLDAFEKQRRDALRRLGYSDDIQGDEQAARDAECLPLWRAIQARARAVATIEAVVGGQPGPRTGRLSSSA